MNESQRQVAGDRQRARAHLFASIFRTKEYQDGKSKAEVDLEILEPLFHSETKDSLADIAADFQSDRPSSAYVRGINTQLSSQVDPGQILQGASNRIFVVVPGIFGDYIENSPFGEVWGENTGDESNIGKFAKKYRSRLKSAPGSHFDLATLNQKNTDLLDHMPIGSIDGQAGQADINITYLKPVMGSLETFGGPEINNDLYIDRLNEFFKVISEEDSKEIYFIGYSQGICSALSLLDALETSSHAKGWKSRVKGVVSLGGVVHGSEVADRALRPGTADHTVLKLFQSLTKSLADILPQPGEHRSNLGHASALARAIGAWTWAAPQIAWHGRDNLATPPSLALENVSSEGISTLQLLDLMKKFTTDFFRLDNFTSDLYGNIERFCKLSDLLQKSLVGLSSEGRKRWLESHRLRNDIEYLSISATMADITTEQNRLSALNTSKYYGPTTPDYPLLRTSHLVVAEESGGLQENDSQVTVVKSRFWPKYLQKLQGTRKSIDEHFLALLGTTHWGMAFSAAGDTDYPNEFPRGNLLYGIGVYTAYLEKSRRGQLPVL